MRTLAILTLLGVLAVSAPALAKQPSQSPSPASQCRAERSAMGVDVFRQTYGTNKNRHNAFGKCVSKKAHDKHPTSVKADVNAAKACKQERQADPQAFAAKYGTNANQRNAFGKCVAKTARTERPAVGS